jgi:hypothetical protein
MKIAVLGALGAVLLLATPSFAQDVRFRAGEGGVSIRTDDGRDGRRDDRRWRDDRRGDWRGDRRGDWRGDRGPDRVIIRDRRPDRVVIRDRGFCRNVTIRSERPNGTVIIRRERRCG